MPTSFTVGQTGLGMELPSLTSLGSTWTSWAHQSWSPDWPYRDHLDCGLAGGEESLRLKASTGVPPPLLGGHAGVTRPPYALCPGARMPLCPPGGSAQDVPSLCGPPGCPLAVTLPLGLFSHLPVSLMAPSTKPPSQGWALHGDGQAAAPARGPPMGTEVAERRLCACGWQLWGPW